MNIKPIKTEDDYEAALKEVERLMDIDPEIGTPECDLLEVLAVLVEAYEKEHYPIEPPTPKLKRRKGIKWDYNGDGRHRHERIRGFWKRYWRRWQRRGNKMAGE